MKLRRFLSSISIRLQVAAIFLSLVGIAFGVKGYFHVSDVFGGEQSRIFLLDLYIQIGIAIGVNIAVAIFIHYTAVKPINELNEIMRKLAKGQDVEEIPYLDAVNQIGSTARKVEFFQRDVRRLKTLQSEREEEQKNLEKERREFLSSLSREFDLTMKAISERLGKSAEQMRQTARTMISGIDTSNNNIQELSESSSHTTDTLNQVAQATEELSEAVQHIMSRAKEANDKAKEADGLASKAGERMSGLSEGADKIGNVIDLIKEIAEQINLLALNATIEAARAGEAGKGFAVVASEVQSLANQTASATQEISSQIESIQGETQGAVSFIESIANSIRDIHNVSSEIAESVENQGVSTSDIARNMQNVSSYATKVSNTSLETREVMQESHDASYLVMDQCENVVEDCKDLNSQVDKFIERVRAS